MDSETESNKSRLLVFLPWLRLRAPIEIGGFHFETVAILTPPEAFPEELRQMFACLRGSYLDISGRPIKDITLVRRTGGEPRYSLAEDEFGTVRANVLLLFFACWSANRFFTHETPTNSSAFRVIGQRFTSPVSTGLALTLRRRDGETLHGGLEHGKVPFVAPPNYAINRFVNIDVGILRALISARTDGTPSYNLLEPVLGLIQLANTDSDLINEQSEIVLLSSAMENLLDVPAGGNKACGFASRFDQVFCKFDDVTVADALKEGRAIDLAVPRGPIPASSVRFAWAHEFYQLRNNALHAKKHTRGWAWAPLEHLIAAAFSIPLLVKVQLENEGQYELSDSDRNSCNALSLLLATPTWNAASETGQSNCWNDVLKDQLEIPSVILDLVRRTGAET